MLFNKLSFIITTHNTKKVVAGSPYAPPNTNMIERTWKSFYKKAIGIEFIKNRVIIFNLHGQQDTEYLRNIVTFAAENDFRLVVDSKSKGYKEVRCKFPECLTTPYIFHTEHDWLLKEEIDIISVLNAFENNDFIKYIRLNKRKNIVFPKLMASKRLGGDLFMEHDKRVKELDICMIPNYSNNPHFERRSALKDLFIPTAKNSNIFHGQNGGAGGFEQPNQEASYNYYINNNKDILKHNAKWGMYCYGAPGFGPAIEHFGI